VKPFVVDVESPIPPSRQIVEAFLDAVAAGTLTPGDRLPSVRDLAVEAMVNPNTVAKAYRDLAQQGIVVARSGSGVYVDEGASEIARRLRRRATLDAFRRAAAEALRAGHDAERMAEALEEIATTSRATSGGRS
jgi:GntR family transcriptional regulator